MSTPSSTNDRIMNGRKKRRVRKTPEEERLEEQKDLERFHRKLLEDRRREQAAEKAQPEAPGTATSGYGQNATASINFRPPEPAPSMQTNSTGKEADLPLPSLLSSQDVMRGQTYWHLLDSPEAKRRAAVMRAQARREYLRKQQQDQVADWLKSSAPIGGGVRPGANARYFNSPGMPSLTGKHPAQEHQAAGIGPTGNVAHELPDLFNRPLAAVATGVNSMLDPKYNETFWEGAKRGLYGYGVDSWGDVFRGRDPLARGLARYPWAQGLYRFGRDFAADAVFDPLNLVAPAKLFKYGRKGLNLLGRGLRTRPGRVAALGAGLTGAGLMYPEESDALVNLGRVYPKAYFFRGIDHRDPRLIDHAFDVMDAFRGPGEHGSPALTELIGSFVAPNALARAYPWGFLMDVPDPSYIADMSPRTMLSEPYTGTQRFHYAKGRRTNEPIDIEAQMARSRPGRYSPDAYVREPESYNLDDLYRDMERGLDPATRDRGNIFNQAQFRYGLRGHDDPLKQIRAVVADPQYQEAAPFIEWAKHFRKPVAPLPYTRNRRFIRRQLANPWAGGWIWEWDPRLGIYRMRPSTFDAWIKHQDPLMEPVIPPRQARRKRGRGYRYDRKSW